MNVGARQVNVGARKCAGVRKSATSDVNLSLRIHAGWTPPDMNVGALVYERISNAARQFNEQRERWLNPPEWVDLTTRAVDAEDDFADVPEEARKLIRHSAIMARAAKDAKLKKRTLTNLYNERPTWLRLLHEQFDRNVLTAYAAVDPEGGWSEDWADVWSDTGAGFPLPDDHPLAARRKETDQLVPANLLRMNLQRAGGRQGCRRSWAEDSRGNKRYALRADQRVMRKERNSPLAGESQAWTR